MDQLKLFVPITKIDAAKRLVYGVATADAPDMVKEVCDYATTKPFYEEWSRKALEASDGKSFGNVRAMHGNVAAGKLAQKIEFNDAAKQIEICAKIVDDGEWLKVEEGVYTGFSQGGRYVKRWKDEANPDLTRYTAEPIEVSLVDTPCLPSATFKVVKADGSEELRKFKVVETPPAIGNDKIAARATELAKAAGDETKWPDHIDAARTELEALAKTAPAVEDKPATPAAAQTEPATAADVAKGNVIEGAEQVWTHASLPGQTFKRKADLGSALAAHAAKAVATAAAAPAVEALAAITAELDKRDGGITQLAYAEAASKVRDIDLAIAKAAGLDAAQYAKVAGFIKATPDDAAVKALIACSTTVDKDGSLKAIPQATVDAVKALAAVAGAIEKRTYSDDERTKMAKEGVAMKDGSYPIPDKDALKDAISAYGRAKNKAATKRHIVRRARALGATDMLPTDWPGSTKDDAAKIDRAELKKGASLYTVSMLLQLLASIESYEEACEYEELWGSAVNLPKDLKDRFGAAVIEVGDIAADILDLILNAMRQEEMDEALERAQPIINLMKAGARHSKSDMQLLNSIHDHAVALGAECEGEGDDAAKMAKAADDLVKMTAERDAMKAALGSQADILKEVLDRVKSLKAIEDTVKRIEAQPVGGGPARTQPVFKHQDGNTNVVDTESALTALEKLSPEQQLEAMIKLAQRAGVTARLPGQSQ